MMTQPLPSCQYLLDESDRKLTAFAGLPLFIDMAIKSGLSTKIAQTLNTKSQGWSDLQIILSLMLLNIAGGDCVEDIERLEQDAGFATVIQSIATHGMTRKERRDFEKRWRKGKERALPSPSVLRRYLEQFHNVEEEEKRIEGKAFIPADNIQLIALKELNTTLIHFLQNQLLSEIATIDQDATLSATNKRSALFNYKKFKSYQPFNTYWSEHGVLLRSEFRDGNVNAGFEQLREFENALADLPISVKKVYLRSDSAGYQHEILKYYAEGENERFGIIEFAISVKVTEEFKKAVSEVNENNWHPIYKPGPKDTLIKTEKEWAEVNFVTNWSSHKKSNPNYRYLAIREKMADQLELNLADAQSEQQELPFQTIDVSSGKYKLHGVVTNRTIPGNDLINWHRERCGASEKVHSVIKSELAGGQFPSKYFGANAAWWQIMLLAFHLSILMKRLVLPKNLKTKNFKGLRFHLIHLPGLVIRHARGLFIKLCGGKEIFDLVSGIREQIKTLGYGPPRPITI